jgi:hypothetical protein
MEDLEVIDVGDGDPGALAIPKSLKSSRHISQSLQKDRRKKRERERERERERKKG